jgi:Flp pilus assembly CpaE family ATPase
VALGDRLDPAALEAMRLSDATLLVTRADVPSVRRGRRILEACAEQGLDRRRWHVVVNRWGQPSQLTADQIEAGIAAPVFAYLPEAAGRVNEAVNQGLLLRELAPGARLTAGFQDLAGMLSGRPQDRKGRSWMDWLGSRRGREAPRSREPLAVG